MRRNGWALPKGLTLIEILVTMALVSLAFAMTATLVRNFSQVSSHLDGKESKQQGALLLLGVCAELEEAFEISSPLNVGDTVTELRLKKYASTPARLASSTLSPTWTPDYVLSIRYFQDGEVLIRESTLPDTSVGRSIVAQRLSGFSATRVSRRAIEVRAGFMESKKLETVSTFAYRWVD